MNLHANLVRTHRRRRREGKLESPGDFHLFLMCELLHNKPGLGSAPPRRFVRVCWPWRRRLHFAGIWPQADRANCKTGVLRVSRERPRTQSKAGGIPICIDHGVPAIWALISSGKVRRLLRLPDRADQRYCFRPTDATVNHLSICTQGAS